MSSVRRVMHVHFWADIKNTAGSVEKVILDFCSNQEVVEQRVACFSPCSMAPYRFMGVDIFPFSESWLRNKIFNKILGLGVFTYPDLIGVLNEFRPDLIHFHNRQELVDSVVKRLAFKPKIVVHYHRHFKNLVVPDSADLLIGVSKETCRYIGRFNDENKRVEVVYNSIPAGVVEFCKANLCNVLPASDRLVLLYGGGGGEHKGIRELVEAIGLISGDFEVRLAGIGIERIKVEDPRIKILGALSSESYLKELHGADVVVMPSYCEPFGLVALEAMHMGKLLVCSNNAGLAEFTDDSCAVHVSPRDVNSLVEGLKRAMQIARNEEGKEIRANARIKSTEFLPSSVGSRLMSLYLSI